jgi:hypothetical protein
MFSWFKKIFDHEETEIPEFIQKDNQSAKYTRCKLCGSMVLPMNPRGRPKGLKDKRPRRRTLPGLHEP